MRIISIYVVCIKYLFMNYFSCARTLCTLGIHRALLKEIPFQRCKKVSTDACTSSAEHIRHKKGYIGHRQVSKEKSRRTLCVNCPCNTRTISIRHTGVLLSMEYWYRAAATHILGIFFHRFLSAYRFGCRLLLNSMLLFSIHINRYNIHMYVSVIHT